MTLALTTTTLYWNLLRFVSFFLATLADPRGPRYELPPTRRNYRVMSDLEVVAALRSGDPGAADELWRRFERLVTFVAADLTNNRDDGQDLAQEVWVSLGSRNWASVCAWENKCPLAAYVSVIATRVVRSKAKKKRDTYLEELQSEPMDPTCVPDPALTADQEAKLRYCMGKLTVNQQQILKLKLVDGYDHSEIARTLNIQEGTSRKRLFDALRTLDRIIRDTHPELLELEV